MSGGYPEYLDLATVAGKLADIGAKRTVATHMSDEVLAAELPAGMERAHDGLVLEIA